MSISVKCDSFKNNSWRKCCDNCLGSLFKCYIGKGYFKSRDYINHMNMHYNDTILYITCIMCNVNQHISGFRFIQYMCRLCIFLHRNRCRNTKDRFKEYAEIFNINV